MRLGGDGPAGDGGGSLSWCWLLIGVDGKVESIDSCSFNNTVPALDLVFVRHLFPLTPL